MYLLMLLSPTALFFFALSWYLHVIKLVTLQTKPMEIFTGWFLFFAPLIVSLALFFNATGAPTYAIVIATIIGVIMAVPLFTSAVVRHFDGHVIIIFQGNSIALFLILWMFT